MAKTKFDELYDEFKQEFREAEGEFSLERGYSKDIQVRITDMKAVIDKYGPKFRKHGYEIDYGAGGFQVYPRKK